MSYPFPVQFRALHSRVAVVGITAASLVFTCGHASTRIASDPDHRFVAVRLPVAAKSANLDFRAASALTWVDDTAVALLDVDDGQIVLQSLRHGVQRRTGRKGDGPGEFRLPVDLLVGRGGEIVVADGLARRLTEIDSQFHVRRSQPLPGSPIHILRLAGDKALVMWVQFSAAGPAVGWVDLTTGSISGQWHPFENAPRLAQAADGIMGPSPFLAATMLDDGHVVVGGGTDYRLFRFTVSGALDLSFGRADARPEAYSDVERAEFERGMQQVTGGRASVASDEVVQALLSRPKPFFAMNAFGSDERGRVWVITSLRANGGTRLDVFEIDGSPLDAITLRDRVLTLAFRRNMLAVLVKRSDPDHEDQYGIDVYRISER